MDTWDAFAGLGERHGGLLGGCWCTYFHPADQEGDRGVLCVDVSAS